MTKQTAIERCWETTYAGDLLGVDAGPPDAVGDVAFLATHSPQRGRLIAGDAANIHAARQSNTPVGLGGVLDTLEADWPRDQPVVWVHGAPGTGKSHLVRLLSIEVDRRYGEDEAEHIVFVPKSATSSIKRVLDLILAGQDGDDIRELRKDIQRSSDQQQSTGELARRLLFELAFVIREDTPDKMQARGWVTAHLDASKALRALLVHDDVLDRASEPGVFSATIAATKLGELKAADVKEGDLEAMPSNLPFTAGTSKDASKLLADVVLQEAACAVINHHLDGAVARVFGITRGLVTNAALEVRRLLQTRGKRLWLLFEDFAVLQGLQSELLDTFTAFDADLCDLRVIAAITPGPFAALPTMIFGRTRTTVDLGIDAASAGDARLDLVARYLNAVRAGDGLLHEESPTIPNACDRCPLGTDHADRCMSAFGTVELPDVGAVSLFPLDRRLLRRAAAKVNPDTDPFKPRYMITEVLRPLLRTHAHTIDDGTFPSEALEERLLTPSDRLLGHVRDDIVDGARRGGASTAEAEREARAAALFGDRPVGLIGDVLSDMLGVDQPDVAIPDSDDSDVSGDPPIPPPPPPPATVVEVRRWIAARHGDGAEASLDGSVRTKLQQHLHHRFVAGATALAAAGPSANEVHDVLDVFHTYDVILDRVGRAGADAGIETAVDPRAVEGAAWDLEGRTPDVSATRLRHATDALIARGADHVATLLTRVRTDEALDHVLAQAVAASVLAGAPVPDRPRDLLREIVAWRPPPGWDRVVTAATAVRQEALTVLRSAYGIRQGTGEPVLDATAVRGALDRLDTAVPVDWSRGPLSSQHLEDAIGKLHGQLDDHLDAARSRLGRATEFVAEQLTGPPSELRELCVAAVPTIELARSLKVVELPSHEWAQLVQAATAIGDLDRRIAVWQDRYTSGASAPGSIEEVDAVSGHQRDDRILGVIKRLIDLAAEVNAAASRDGLVSAAGEVLDVSSQVRTAIDRFNALLGRLDHGR